MADNSNGNTAEDALGNAGADISMMQDEENGNMYSGLPPAEQGPENAGGPQMSFLSYLTSPIVTLVVGNGDAAAVLTAHQALLEISPYFNAICAAFTEDGSVSSPVHTPQHRAVCCCEATFAVLLHSR